MKNKAVNILILLMVLFICTACSFSNRKNIDVNENIANSILTKMPICANDKTCFIAENSKILRDTKNNIIIDECDDDIISDIYCDDDFLYYTKQNNKNIDVISVNLNDYDIKATVFTIEDCKNFGMGDDFIYATDNAIYYYNYIKHILYKYQDDTLLEILKNVTAVTFGEDNIYYADFTQTLYKADYDFSNPVKIFESTEIKNSQDEFLVNWQRTCLNQYSVIKDIAECNDKIIFRFCGDPAVDKGILMWVDVNGMNYNNFSSVQSYQISGEQIIAFGTVPDENISSKIFSTDFIQNKILKIEPTKYMYIADGIMYYQIKSKADSDIWNVKKYKLKR